MNSFMRFSDSADGQFLFDRNLNFLGWFLWVALKLVIYSPFILLGVMGAYYSLNKRDPALLWLILSSLLSVLAWSLLQGLKRLSIYLRRKGNGFWLVTYLVSIAI